MYSKGKAQNAVHTLPFTSPIDESQVLAIVFPNSEPERVAHAIQARRMDNKPSKPEKEIQAKH